ncbi:hypothetical protein [Pseudopelagicola sp. nBUS_19]|uniref:hypothetical protein n=1 Tax=Pseudopelagicola sp. nBUS_19 TaxID=3395316 RepID=UPI003EBB0B29
MTELMRIGLSELDGHLHLEISHLMLQMPLASLLQGAVIIGNFKGVAVGFYMPH